VSNRYAIACNYDVGTNIASEGALCYVAYSRSGDPTRMRILVRSRSGRWVCKWERTARLKNFRVKTIVDDHHPRSTGGEMILFEAREQAEEEAQELRQGLLMWRAERDRPREFHDPGDEDRRG